MSRTKTVLGVKFNDVIHEAGVEVSIQTQVTSKRKKFQVPWINKPRNAEIEDNVHITL